MTSDAEHEAHAAMLAELERRLVVPHRNRAVMLALLEALDAGRLDDAHHRRVCAELAARSLAQAVLDD